MEDVRLTATNPADSSIVPVACNSKGELLLEEPIAGAPGEDGEDGATGPQGPQGERGPQGEQGEQGPRGEDGKDGKDGKDGEDGKDGIDGFPLPPDPYEGALLGWLNDGLAWVGSPPVPIPEGVFGPIASWDPDSGYLTVDGTIPSQVDNGVYVYQCNETGVLFTAGWNTGKVWSDYINMTPYNSNYSKEKAFDSYPDTQAQTATANDSIDWTLPADITGVLEINFGSNNTQKVTDSSGNAIAQNLAADGTFKLISSDISAYANQRISVRGQNQGSAAGSIAQVRLDGQILVNTDQSLNLRVNQRFGDGLIGAASSTVNFTIGMYLKVPEQRVAPWVLYENDPTSLIDHLRSSQD